MPAKSDLLPPVRKGWNLEVRPLSADTDMPVIYKWISEDCAGQFPRSGYQPDLLREAYSSILASDAVQSFIGMVDDHPVCEIELYKVRQHAISLAYEPGPADHYLDLLPTPAHAQEYMIELLKNSLEYFFSFGDVHRIMAEADLGNECMNKLLVNAGFHLYKRIRAPYRISNLYFCTRRSLVY